MKKILICLSLIIVMIIGSYAQEKKSQVEGTWKLVSAKWTIRGQAFTFPDQISGEQIKMFTKGHVTFVSEKDTYLSFMLFICRTPKYT